MFKLIKRLYTWLKGWDYRIKFLMVGGLNTAIGLGVYWIVLICFGVNIFHASDAKTWQVITATVASQILGLVNSYFWNKFFTFESKKKSGAETVRFILVYLVAFAADYGMKFGFHKIKGMSEFAIAIIVTLTIMVISFVGQKFFVFKHKKQPAQTQLNDEIPLNNEKLSQPEIK